MLNLNARIGLNQTSFKANHIVSNGITPELKDKLAEKGYTLQTPQEFKNNPAENPAVAIRLDDEDKEIYSGDTLATLVGKHFTTKYGDSNYIGKLDPYRNIIDAYNKQAIMIRTGSDANNLGTKQQLKAVFNNPDNFTTSEDLIKKIDEYPYALN